MNVSWTCHMVGGVELAARVLDRVERVSHIGRELLHAAYTPARHAIWTWNGRGKDMPEVASVCAPSFEQPAFTTSSGFAPTSSAIWRSSNMPVKIERVAYSAERV